MTKRAPMQLTGAGYPIERIATDIKIQRFESPPIGDFLIIVHVTVAPPSSPPLLKAAETRQNYRFKYRLPSVNSYLEINSIFEQMIR